MITTQTEDIVIQNGWAIGEVEEADLVAAGQFFAAGFLSGENLSINMRHASGIASNLSNTPLLKYDGQILYPAVNEYCEDPRPQAVWPHYVAIDVGANGNLARQLLESAKTDTERSAFSKLVGFVDGYPMSGGYTHSIVNFGRILSEGLDHYHRRIDERLNEINDSEKRDLYESLVVVLGAIDGYRSRIADYLGSLKFDDTQKEANRKRLFEAYDSRLSMKPVNGFYEAMVATSFIYLVDGTDDLGRFDQFMWPYFDADIKSGTITSEEALEMVGCLWGLVDSFAGWNVALAGSNSMGNETSNDLTVICLKAGKGRRRPNMALRLRRDTPERIWDEAINTISGGTGIPALYCEENYLAGIDKAHLNLTPMDRFNYAFGGCTELMIHGCSNVGSLDWNFSAIETMEKSLAAILPAAESFEDLVDRIEQEMRVVIGDAAREVSRCQEIRANYHPQLIRTLLIDDCIDAGKNYYDGGARYNWSIVNVVGLSNTIDSLIAIKHAVYEENTVDAKGLLAALSANFEGHESLREYLVNCPRYGNDDPEVNDMANRLSGLIYKEFKKYAPWRGGKFLCGTLMFVTYGWFGEPVGATPDGRYAGTPVADSAGPVQGRDKKGPTAMLHSVASQQQLEAPGTLVVNIRVARELVSTHAGREKLKSLIRGYFDMGGMQLQVNVVDQKILKDAYMHPEKHEDLVIRMGGYSEYWRNLTDDLRLSVLERTEHSV